MLVQFSTAIHVEFWKQPYVLSSVVHKGFAAFWLWGIFYTWEADADLGEGEGGKCHWLSVSGQIKPSAIP